MSVCYHYLNFSANTAQARCPRMGMAQRPAVIIFDLDGCLWDPEMYELWGGGAPFSDNGDGTLADKAGVTVRLLGAV